jgi:signal transduction histidine kinase
MTHLVIASWTLTLAAAGLLTRAYWRLVLVARACHELRGPLCAARLGLEALPADPGRVLAIELELRRAARALDDLAGARAASAVELVDLAALVAAHEPSWQAVAAAHGASLRVEAAPSAVLADPLRIAQACANLVGNAAEHGGGLVWVRVLEEGELARIEVADDGPGLPSSVSALTACARVRRGPRGHGLAIAAAIAEHHGGRLASAPSATGGARLLLEMPAAKVSA